MISSERQKGESFDNYKKRLKKVNKAIKVWLCGRYVWKSKSQGTFRRENVK